MWLNPLSMPMAMVTIEDEGGHPNIERADYNNERFEGAESKGATALACLQNSKRRRWRQIPASAWLTLTCKTR